MRRWLFERLQQCVERIFRQHMNFVDDVDFVTRRHGRIAHCLDDLADIIDAGVRCRIHFDDVDEPTLRNRDAGFARPARIDRRPARAIGPDAVQRLGDQPRSRSLSNPTNARQDKRMRQPVALDRVA